MDPFLWFLAILAALVIIDVVKLAVHVVRTRIELRRKLAALKGARIAVARITSILASTPRGRG